MKPGTGCHQIYLRNQHFQVIVIEMKSTSSAAFGTPPVVGLQLRSGCPAAARNPREIQMLVKQIQDPKRFSQMLHQFLTRIT